MIVGIGTDILAIERLKRAIAGNSEAFLYATYTKKEQELIESRQTPLYSYATRFAGKEAVFKALDMPADDFRLTDIEILQDLSEAPIVYLHGKTCAFAESKGVNRIHISLSYDSDYAIAFAVAETQ